MTPDKELTPEEMREELEGLRKIVEVAKAAVSTLELEVVLQTILKSCMDVMEVPAGSIALYDEADRRVTLAAHAGLSAKLVAKDRWRVKQGGLTHKILEEGHLFIVEDTYDAPFFNNPLATEEGIRSLIAVPLKIGVKIVGILYVDDFKPRTYPEHRLSMLRVLSSFAAMCIDNARLHFRTRKLACTDGLTGLYNHRQFKEFFDREMNRATRMARPLSLAMLDIDDFKKFNDEYGHAIGDQALVSVAEIINEHLRSADLPCRYGGEEFAIILPDTDPDEAAVVAERLRRVIEEEATKGLSVEVKLSITVSIGLSSYPKDGRKMEFLLKIADDLLYGAKKLGKNKVYYVK
ncbi:MAG: GGDEF domain-containing protein [Desulfuromonas sp.]|nr:MAG: GGDEF domain-containing protein [Desulfuromonas sp.]